VLLEGVSLRLGAGEALVLRGPNGCGKTTLLRTIAGLQPALKGEIDLPPEAIAYAAHADGLKATLTVAKTCASGPRSTAHARDCCGGRAITADEPLKRAGRRRGAKPFCRAEAALGAGAAPGDGAARFGCWTSRPFRWMRHRSRCLGRGAQPSSGGRAVLIATHIDLGLPEGECST
jgi:heme exporter protein A